MGQARAGGAEAAPSPPRVVALDAGSFAFRGELSMHTAVAEGAVRYGLPVPAVALSVEQEAGERGRALVLVGASGTALRPFARGL